MTLKRSEESQRDPKQAERERKRKRNGEIKQTLYEATQSTTAHGLPNIFRCENILLKLMWIVCTIGSTYYCIYSIVQSVNAYFQWGVVTQIQTFYENPTEYPTITMCNANLVTTYDGLEFVSQVLKNNSIDDVRYTNLLQPYEMNQQGANVYTARLLTLSNMNAASDEQKKSFGYTHHFVMSVCMFGNNVCDMDRDFRYYFHQEYGTCFQFNSGRNGSSGEHIEPLSSSSTGKRFGLNAMIFVVYPLAYLSSSVSTDYGLYVLVHNRTESPLSTKYIAVSPGTSTNIVLSKTFHKKLPDPYNDCHDNLTPQSKRFTSFFYRKTFELGYEYKQRDCLNLCVQDYIINACNCSSPLQPPLYNVPFCKTRDDIGCIFLNLFMLYYTRADSSFTDYCPMECSSTKYDLTVSSTLFPSPENSAMIANDTRTKERYQYTNKTLTAESVRENYVWLNIYFDDLQYTLISESPQQTDLDLMSNVGGTLGLYLGVSFLSFVELFEAFFQTLIIVFKNRKQPPKIQSKA